VEELLQPVHGAGIPRAADAESHPEVIRHVEAVTGRQEQSVTHGRLTEAARIPAVHEARKRRHAAAGSNPVQHTGMPGQHAIQQREVGAGDFTGAAQHDVAMADGNLREELARSRVGDAEVLPRVQAVRAPPEVRLDDPAHAQA